MTNREFIHKKFGLFLLAGMTLFFATFNFALVMLQIWYPKADMIPSLADWVLKAALGPLIGALISSIITPHESERREDSTAFVASGDTKVEETVTRKTTTAKPLVAPDNAVVIQNADSVKVEGAEIKKEESSEKP